MTLYKLFMAVMVGGLFIVLVGFWWFCLVSGLIWIAKTSLKL